MIELRLKDFLCNLNTICHILAFSNFDQFLDIWKLIFHSRRSCITTKLFDESLRSFEENLCISSSVSKECVEMISSPLYAMFNLIREISQCAHWNRFFGWILGITVTLSFMWDYHLLVSFSSECSWFEKRLLVPDTLSINVKSSLDVVNCIHDEIFWFPELIIEKTFSVGSNQRCVCMYIEFWIHDFSLATGTFRFWFSNMLLSEKKLSIQVWNFYVVIVSDLDFSSLSTAETHKSESLKIFAT